MKVKRKPRLYESIIIFALMMVIMAISIVLFDADPHIPMLFGTGLVAIMSLILGYDWSEIEDGMVLGISRALQSIMILAVIGVLIGTWILSGVVPSMIYYGLQIINPTFFLLTTVLITSITSLAIGSS